MSSATTCEGAPLRPLKAVYDSRTASEGTAVRKIAPKLAAAPGAS